MRFLALDLGTQTGWATNVQGRAESGVQDFRPRRGESPGMRFVRFNAWLAQWAGVGYRPEIIVYEMPHLRGGAAATVLAGMETRVHEFCARESIEYHGVHSATLKKHATGKGNADKSAMRRGVHRLCGGTWPSQVPQDDNEIDALALLHWALTELMTGHAD